MSLSVVFLTEAGAAAGLGHLRRCQALGAALRRHGATTRFLIDGADDPADSDAVCLGWTREPAAALASVAAHRPDAVVVDSYRAAPLLLSRLREAARCLVAIDDLADRALP